jgi:MFS family permease
MALKFVGRRSMTGIWARPDRFFGWKALGAAAAMYFALTGLLLYSFPVFLPFLCKAFGWSRASVSWANSLALVVQGLASPLAGMYVMRFGAKKALAAGGIFCVLCFVVASFHTRLWIRDSTGSYKSAWELAIIILAIGLVSLILARPPVHPSMRGNRADSIVGVKSSSSMN